MCKKVKLEEEIKWSKVERKAAEERQLQRYLAYVESGLSMTKWIKEKSKSK